LDELAKTADGDRVEVSIGADGEETHINWIAPLFDELNDLESGPELALLMKPEYGDGAYVLCHWPEGCQSIDSFVYELAP
jgi:hypothetical protein